MEETLEISPAPAKNKGGRPRKLTTAEAMTPENLMKIIARVGLGETLRKITEEPGMPSASTFRVAVMKEPSLREAWEVAKAERPHMLFEEAIDLARHLAGNAWAKEDTNNVGALRIAIEALREAAARMAPREYGVRPASSVVVPVQINTSLDLSTGPVKGARKSDYSFEVSIPVEEAAEPKRFKPKALVAPTEEPLP
jgi:hypothetical protein